LRSARSYSSLSWELYWEARMTKHESRFREHDLTKPHGVGVWAWREVWSNDCRLRLGLQVRNDPYSVRANPLRREIQIPHARSNGQSHANSAPQREVTSSASSTRSATRPLPLAGIMRDPVRTSFCRRPQALGQFFALLPFLGE